MSRLHNLLPFPVHAQSKWIPRIRLVDDADVDVDDIVLVGKVTLVTLIYKPSLQVCLVSRNPGQQLLESLSTWTSYSKTRTRLIDKGERRNLVSSRLTPHHPRNNPLIYEFQRHRHPSSTLLICSWTSLQQRQHGILDGRLWYPELEG